MSDDRAAKDGDTILVHYTGTLDDGSQFDSSEGRDPLEVTLGSGGVIAGFDKALQGMKVGETKKVRLEPDEAYGKHNPSLVYTIERSQIGGEGEIQVGTELMATDAQGRQMRLLVTKVDGDDITLDANHPLAGKALTFELTLHSFKE